MKKVVVLDFGAQYGQLIARRVRDLHVYSEVVPCTVTADELRLMEPSAIILSGGPASVYAEDAPGVDPGIFDLGIPVLGLCYGMQLMAQALGGEVEHNDVGEYGPAEIRRGCASVLLTGTPDVQTVWMSHRDAVVKAPEDFMVTATTETCPVAAMELPRRRLYATQFHPEVRHTPAGDQILSNFLFGVCDLEPTWTMANFIDDAVAKIRSEVGEGRVILALSGGVDSAVTAALVYRAVAERLTCVFVDHGLLRAGEPESVEHVFGEVFGMPLVVVRAQERYLSLLAGVSDPEKKRQLIGAEFWKIFFEEAEKLGDAQFLAQGTIYPDIIESGARKTSGKASTIKSHHNLIPFPPGVSFELIEPLDHLFKDEVRVLGEELGLPAELVWRQPFPGPGLAIRIIGEVTAEKLSLVRDADAIVREEVGTYNERLFAETGERNSAHACWQYFAVLPDVRSVGVMGDERTYERPVIVRAVESADAMTADWARLPHDVLAKMSRRIVSEVAGVNRVVYDITSKPPATIEWE